MREAALCTSPLFRSFHISRCKDPAVVPGIRHLPQMSSTAPGQSARQPAGTFSSPLRAKQEFCSNCAPSAPSAPPATACAASAAASLSSLSLLVTATDFVNSQRFILCPNQLEVHFSKGLVRTCETPPGNHKEKISTCPAAALNHLHSQGLSVEVSRDFNSLKKQSCLMACIV